MHRRHVALVVRWPTGGIRTYLKYVYKQILSRGWKATLIAPPGDETVVLLNDLGSTDVDYVWIERKNVVVSLAAGLRQVMATKKIDLVHSHGLTSAVSVCALPRFARVPHLVTLHDIFLESQFRGAKGIAMRCAADLALQSATVVQSVSEDAKDNLLKTFPKLGNKKGKAVWISNGIDSDLFAKDVRRDLRGELQLNEDVFIIGFLGRFMAQKGFRTLVQAVSKLSVNTDLGHKFAVVAVGGGGFAREDRAFIREMGLDSIFRFLPFLPQVAPTIRGMDLVAIPSLWEACPILPMETLASGVPLVASSCIGLRETVRNTPALVVPPGDAEALASAISHAILGGAEFRQLFEQFAHQARLRFSSKASADALLNLLNKTVDDSGSR